MNGPLFPLSTVPVGPDAIPALVERLAAALLRRGAMLATAESCTGGLIAGACTELAGSSAWFDRGYVSYSNEAKVELLGVDAALIGRHGAVSEPVVQAMAEGAVVRSNGRAQVAVAVTGVAGPAGGSVEKPVGTVWFGWAVGGDIRTGRRHFEGDRAAVRQATVQHALRTLLMHLDDPEKPKP
ncbi:MAG: CinA family protein [Janthinobacterium lividum]